MLSFRIIALYPFCDGSLILGFQFCNKAGVFPELITPLYRFRKMAELCRWFCFCRFSHDDKSPVGLTVTLDSKAFKGQLFDYEIVVVDDGSKEDTVNGVKKLNDPKVCLIKLKHNYGHCPPIMAGIDHSTGDYISTINGDLHSNSADSGRRHHLPRFFR